MSNQPSSRWADLRDFCSAIREVVLVAAMLSLLVVPSAVRSVLERAGIRSVAGVEFDVENLAQSREELDAALAQVDVLKSQLATAQQQVQAIASAPTASPSVATLAPVGPAGGSAAPAARTGPTLSSVSRLLATMKDQADETDRSLRRSKTHADRVLEKSGVQLTPPEELFRQSSAPDTDTSTGTFSANRELTR